MILHGVDVHARYQKGLKAGSLAGVDFVITKATGGTGLVVDGWLGMLAGAKLTGVYHYAREKGFQGTAAQEAAHFIAQARLAPVDAMLILDWEEASNTNLGDTAWVLEWCQLVEKALGRRPVIYTGNQVLKQNPGWWDWSNAHNYFLWYARYPSKDPVGWKNYSLPTVPNWPDAKICMWQYSSAGGVPGWRGPTSNPRPDVWWHREFDCDHLQLDGREQADRGSQTHHDELTPERTYQMSFSEPMNVGAWRIYGGDYRALEATIHSGDAPADLSRFADWRAQWRPYASSRVSVDLVVDAERASGGIVVVAIPGELSGVDGQLRSGVFDVQASDEGVVRTFFRGTIVWEGDVTHG